MRLLRPTSVAVLALLLSSCVNTTSRFVVRYSTKEAKIAAILEQAGRELESQMADGPPYRLTELRGMDAANKLGSEGKDASALWEREINRHYRERKSATLRYLREEISSYGAKYIDSILGAYVPNALNRHWKGSKEPDQLAKWGWNLTDAYRTAHDSADCQSLASTPEAWHQLYPDREPFTFRRFGIDEPLVRTWCPALATKAVVP